jgi:hypothetical protein
MALSPGIEARLSFVLSVFTKKRTNRGTDRVAVELPVGYFYI